MSAVEKSSSGGYNRYIREVLCYAVERRQDMPFIDVKMFPGRDEKVKKDFAEKLIESASAELGTPKEAFSVAITDVKPEDWNVEVADKVNESSIKAGKMYRSK